MGKLSREVAGRAALLLLVATYGCETSDADTGAANDMVAAHPEPFPALSDGSTPHVDAGGLNTPQSPSDAASSEGPDASTAAAGDASTEGTQGVERDVLRPARREPSPALLAMLRVPEGFAIQVFARELQHARMLAVRDGYVYVTRPMQGDVVRLVDADGDGAAEERSVVANGLPDVHGIAIDGPYVFLATPTHVYRASLAADGTLGTPAAIITDLPAGGQHPNRTLAVGPDRKLYISVGSPCDACAIDDPEYATILRAELDGARREILASGLRNTIGFGWHPTTGELWGFDHGSDWRGDDTPPEEINRIVAGADYGWPYCYGKRQIDPVIEMPRTMSKEAYCATTAEPTLEQQAHEAPIGWVFYTAAQFPAPYRGGAFVAFRGSWNRIPPVGYRVAYVAFDNGVPVRIDDFVSGFLIENGTAQFGRLAGMAVSSDGSLLFTDDENGVIYRVSYRGSGT